MIALAVFVVTVFLMLLLTVRFLFDETLEDAFRFSVTFTAVVAVALVGAYCIAWLTFG